MIYLAAGLPRSGSTWLYNALRLLLTHVGTTLAAGWVGDKAELMQAENCLIKLHRPDPDLFSADFIFTCHRDLRDLVASYWRKFGRHAFPPAFGYVLNDVMEYYDCWAPRAIYDMKYEQMIVDKPAELGRLATALGLAPGLDFTAIAAEIEALTCDPGRKNDHGWDSLTLLLEGHITNGQPGARAELTPEELAGIENVYESWLTAHGYEVT